MNVIQRCMELLIEDSLKRRSDEIFKSIGLKSYLKEYCTIKLSGSRQAGHSTAILNCIKLFKNPFLITPKSKDFEHYKKINNKIDKIKFASFGSLDRLRGFSVDAIFVDCASFLSNKQKDYLYDTLIQNKNITILFIE